MKSIRKEYYINHYDNMHKRVEIRFYYPMPKYRFAINWRFRDWYCANTFGVKFDIQMFWFGFGFFIFPTIGINHDGRDKKMLGFDGRIIRKSYHTK